jgi:hypothetical protein
VTAALTRLASGFVAIGIWLAVALLVVGGCSWAVAQPQAGAMIAGAIILGLVLRTAWRLGGE